MFKYVLIFFKDKYAGGQYARWQVYMLYNSVLYITTMSYKSIRIILRLSLITV